MISYISSTNNCSFISSFCSLQHFISCSCPSALVRNSNKRLKRGNIQPYTDLIGKVFYIKYGVYPRIWIFYQIKKAHCSSQGFFVVVFFNYEWELLDWSKHARTRCWHIPTPQGTNSLAQDLSGLCPVDVFISMFICNLYNLYNELVIVS